MKMIALCGSICTACTLGPLACASDCSLTSDFPTTVEACQRFTVHLTPQLNGTYTNVGYTFWADAKNPWNKYSTYSNFVAYTYDTPGTYQWEIRLFSGQIPFYDCGVSGTVVVTPTTCLVSSWNATVPATSQRWIGTEAILTAISSGCPSSTMIGSMTWGDGPSETFYVESGSPVKVIHNYQANGTYQWKYTVYANTCLPPREKSGTIIIADLGDLVVDRLETVQLIRDAKGLLPFVAGKSTVVRVLPKVTGASPAPIAQVTGTLRGYHRGKELPGSPCAPSNPGITAYSTPDATKLDHSLNFTLPPDWTTTGELSLRAEVTEPNHQDSKTDNNTMTKAVTFQYRVLHIRYLLCTNEGLALPPVSPARAQATATLLKKLYPASEVIYGAWDDKVRGIPPMPAGWQDPDNLLPDNWYGYQLAAIMAAIPQWSRPDVLIGFLSTTENFGRAYLKLRATSKEDIREIIPQAVAAMGMSSAPASNDQFVLCHEVGHLYYLGHPGSVKGTVRNQLSTPLHIEDRMVNQDGVLSLRDASNDWEMMDPGKTDVNFWISQFSWTNLFAGFRTLDPKGAANVLPKPTLQKSGGPGATNELLLVRGWVAANGRAGLEYAYPALSSNAVTEDGPCAIRFEDNTGQALAETRFGVSSLDSYGRVVDQGFFVLAAPQPAAFSSLAVTVSGKVLARRYFSAYAPLVNFTTPAPGQPLAINGTVGWVASDADGDSLRYLLSYSPDGRATWIPLAFDLQNPAYDLDTSLLPGGAQFWLRVVASDGLRVGTAEAGPFTLPDKEPTLTIVSPVSNQVCGASSPLILSGEAYDLEDGPILETNLVWTSDIAGPLGVGSEVRVDSLSPGSHWITLAARDSRGHVATARVPIRVTQDPRVDCESGAADLGVVELGQSIDRLLDLRNQGGSPLIVDSITSNDPRFSVLLTNLPITITPGNAVPLAVRFTPLVGGPCKGTLGIASNDPEQRTYLVTLTGVEASALEVWRQNHFGAYDDAGERADNADPDGDRVLNLVEFAFGLNPVVYDPGPGFSPALAGNVLTLSFQQPSGVAGITYLAEAASSLTAPSWTTVPDTGTNGMHTFGLRVDGAQTQFLRLKVSKP